LQTEKPSGFGSLTRYDADYLFVPNEPDRYTRSLRFDFTYNADGALDPYIPKNSPGQNKGANGLLAPGGRFSWRPRRYGPKASLLESTWKPSAVKRVA
jgi:hypothetical protein